MPVVFGAGLIVLLLLVADGLGRGPAVVAGVLTAISPAMVFYSRYYIQETLLVFFTFAAIGCAGDTSAARSIGWAVAAGASLGLMHATKETWVLAAAAMAVAVALSLVWARLGGRGRRQRAEEKLAAQVPRLNRLSTAELSTALCRLPALGRIGGRCLLLLVRHELARPPGFDPRLQDVLSSAAPKPASTIIPGTIILISWSPTGPPRASSGPRA